MRGFKGLLAFLSHFPSFLDKTPLWRQKTLGCGIRTWLEADPEEMEIPTPPRITSERYTWNQEWEEGGSLIQGSSSRPSGTVLVAFGSNLGTLLGGRGRRSDQVTELGLGWIPIPLSTPLGWSRSLGRIWNRFPELLDTEIAQLHVGTFYSLDALSHCFCSTAKDLLIPNCSPSPS